MGVTSFDEGILAGLVVSRNIKSVIELGAQNNYADHPTNPYMRLWYEARGIKYLALDLSGEDGCVKVDISKPLEESPPPADMVTDFGTSEHVSDDGNSYGTGKFSLLAYYNCWLNKHNLCKIGGVIFSENPKAGNWRGHGFNYLTQDFYTQLLTLADYHQFALTEHPAMGNIESGWNIVSILIKTGEKFPTFDEFKTLPIYKF